MVEEFSVEDGELKLVKKKVTKKKIPPDIKAVKLLLDESGEARDEEIEDERGKLLNMREEQN